MAKKKNKAMKVAGKIVFTIVQPFMPLIIFLVCLLLLVGMFVDIFDWKINNEDEDSIKLDLAYYAVDEFFDDIKSFVSSAWDFLTGKSELEWPVKGHDTITSKYGYRDAPVAGASSFHSGIDIGAPEGTDLIASIDGEITKASWNGASGYSITIKGDKYTVSYGHCSPDFIVEVGDKVKRGDVIGNVGPTIVYGVENNPYTDGNGNPTNRCNNRVSLPFYSKEGWQINRSRKCFRKRRRIILMIIIYTGNHEIDKILENEIKGSMVVSYSDFIIEDNKFENQTAIISAKAIERDLREYLFRLRQLNIRVIVIFKDEKLESELIKITLETGIYDLIFGNFYPSELKEILDKPRTFKDIANMYKKIYDLKIKKIKTKSKN